MSQSTRTVLFLFGIVLFAPSQSYASPKFEDAVIFENKELLGSKAHEIAFKKQDGTGFSDFQPGDLILLRKTKLSAEAHKPHVYAISEFEPSGKWLKIIVDPNYRGGISHLPRKLQKLSQQLTESKINNKEFRIRVLKTGFQEKGLFSGPILMAGIGGAVTHQLGLLKHLESTGYQYPIWFVQTVPAGQVHFVQDQFRELEKGSLKDVFRHFVYETNSKEKVPHIQDKLPQQTEAGLPQDPSYLERYMDLFYSQMGQVDMAHPWSLLVMSFDANWKQESKVESDVEVLLEQRRNLYKPAPSKDRYFRSQWTVLHFWEYL